MSLAGGTNGGAVNTAPTGGGETYTQKATLGTTASHARAIAWTMTATASATFNVSAIRPSGDATTWWGVAVWVYRDSDGFGAAGAPTVNSTSNLVTWTTTGDNSALLVGSADWNAVDGATRTRRTVNSSTGTEETYFRDSATWAVYGQRYDDAGAAGSKTAGYSAPTGQASAIIGIEIQAASGEVLGEGTAHGDVEWHANGVGENFDPDPITLRASGTVTGATALVTAVNPAVPTGATTGDLSVLAVMVKPYNATITTPSGWTKIGEATNGTVANSAADLGSTKVALYVKESAAVGAIGNIGQTTANSMGALIHVYAKDTTGTWDYSVYTDGGDTTQGANYSATGAAGLDVATGDWVAVAVCVNGDVGTPSAITLGGMAGATLGTFDVSENAVTTGNDISRIYGQAAVTAGSSVAAPTLTYTNSSSGSGAAMWLRIRQVLPTSPTTGTSTGGVGWAAAAVGSAEPDVGAATGAIGWAATGAGTAPVAVDVTPKRWTGAALTPGTVIITGNVNTAGNGDTIAIAGAGTATATADGVDIIGTAGNVRRLDLARDATKYGVAQTFYIPYETPTGTQGVSTFLTAANGANGSGMHYANGKFGFQNAAGADNAAGNQTTVALLVGHEYQIDQVLVVGTSITTGRYFYRVKDLTDPTWNTTGDYWYDSGYTINTNTFDITLQRQGRVGSVAMTLGAHFRQIGWGALAAVDTSLVRAVAETHFLTAPTSGPPTTGSADGAIEWAASGSGAMYPAGTATGAVGWVGSSAGQAIKAGTTTGTVGWAGTSTGTKAPAGIGAGAVAWIGTGAGAKTPAGTTTGAINWVGSGAGQRSPAGTVTGAIGWAAAGVGTKLLTGTAAGTVGWAGTATGSGDPDIGTVAGAIAWAGTATGSKPSGGTAIGAIGWAGTGTGIKPLGGAASGTVGWAGVGEGSGVPYQGTVIGVVGWIATGTGSVLHASTAAGAVDWAGTGAGAKATAGSVTGAVGWAAAGNGSAATYQGAAAGAAGWAGIGTGTKTPAGVATGTTGWAGTASGSSATYQAAAVGTVGWAGTGTGTKPLGGTATGAVGWVGIGAGTGTIYLGVAAGTAGWAGAATGSGSTYRATVTGTVTWAATGAGEKAITGIATGTTGWAASAAGSGATYQAASSGAVSWAGAALGFAPIVGGRAGAATGTDTWSGGATGSTSPQASSIGAVTWSGTATSASVYQGSASGTVGWVGAGSGSGIPDVGTATGTVGWTGSAVSSGTVYLGTATGAVTITGAATGSRSPVAAATGTVSWSAAGTGTKPLGGSVAGAVAWVGTGSGSGATYQGAGTGAVAWAGSALGFAPVVGSATGAATGTIAWVATGIGSTPPTGQSTGSVAFMGSGAGIMAAAGSATGEVAWTAVAAGAATHQGVASGAVGWAGSASASAISAGAATGTWSIGGSTAGNRAPIGTAGGTITWTSVAQGIITVTGAATGSVTWAGATTGFPPNTDPRNAIGAVVWAGSATGSHQWGDREPPITVGGPIRPGLGQPAVTPVHLGSVIGSPHRPGPLRVPGGHSRTSRIIEGPFRVTREPLATGRMSP